MSGLETIHNAGFMHGDLKLENILIDYDGKLKLADFGLSCRCVNNLVRAPKGSIGYQAPEILEQKPFDGKKSDIFSIGVLLFKMVVGHPPFTKAELCDGFYKMIRRRDFRRFWRVHLLKVKGVTEDFKRIIESLLAYEPEKRPTIKKLLECMNKCK